MLALVSTAIVLLTSTPGVIYHTYRIPCASEIVAYHRRELEQGFSADASDITHDRRNTSALFDLKMAGAFIERAPSQSRDLRLKGMAARYINDATDAVLEVAGDKAHRLYSSLVPCVKSSPSTHLWDAKVALDIATYALQREVEHRPHLYALRRALHAISVALAILPEAPTQTRLRSPSVTFFKVRGRTRASFR